MMRLESNDYYRIRLEAERQAAVTATCPQAKRAHEEMALAYEQLVQVAPVTERAPIRSSNIR